MKNQLSAQNLQKFVYIDSSEEDQPFPKQKQSNNKHKQKNKVKRQCSLGCQPLLTGNNHKQALQKIIKSQMEKLKYGNAVLVEPNDKEIAQNVYKRQEKYRYFLEQMHIDEKYNNIINEKVEKVRQQNERKKVVLQKKRNKQKCQQQQCHMIKNIIQKNEKQKKVLNGINKIVHELGVERNIQTAKQVKRVVSEQRNITQAKLQSLKIKQKNDLQELKQKYEEIKVQKRVNELDQKKVLKDLLQQIQKKKQTLKQQLIIRKDFII